MATDRISKTAELVIESGGIKPISKAMREAGYPKTTASNPHKITRSKKWAKLMEKYLPEKHLAEKHKEFLDAPKVVTTYRKGELETQVEEVSANAVKALDMAYKLRGSYTAEKKEIALDNSGQEVIKAILDSLRAS